LSQVAQDRFIKIKQEILQLEPRLRASYGRRIIERHAPELLDWLLKFTGQKPPEVPKPIIPPIKIAQSVRFDPELARLAYMQGVFPLFRMWVYSVYVVGDGSGWVNKRDVLDTLNRFDFSLSRRHLNRLIQRGNGVFWTLDKVTSRVYLTGYEKLSVTLTARSVESQDRTLETNRPGVRRVVADLSGSLEDAIANTYAAWFRYKDKGEGVTISRVLLSELWGASVSTLLAWESASGISKSANYAQSHETSIDKIPSHAYLCKGPQNRSEFVSWQLSNTYRAPKEIQQHPHVGKSRNARELVNIIVNEAQEPDTLQGQPEQSGLNVGSLKLGRLYFDDEKRCSKHLLNHQDVFVPHYFLLGNEGRIRIFEKYDILSNAQQTSANRDFAGERDLRFAVKRMNHLYALSKGQKL
jgi:hypothetical protein